MAAISMSSAVAVLSRVRASWANTLTTLVNFLASPTMAVLSRTSSVQTIPNNTWTAISWDAPPAADDPTGAWSSSAPTQWNPQVQGWYECVATVGWASNPTGARNVDVWLNGAAVTPVQADDQPAPSGGLTHTATVWVYLNGSSDYVEMRVLQSSGGNLNAQYTMTLRAKWFHA